MVAASELNVNTGASARDMADAIFGTGVTVTSASYTGAANASGIYTDGLSMGPGVMPSGTGVILSTGDARDFTSSTAGAHQAPDTSGNTGAPREDDLAGVAGASTFDAAVFEATFIPESGTLMMQIVFSSEEYLEYVTSGLNGAMAIWVNGAQATLTVGDGDITINTINTGSDENLYVDNPQSMHPFNTELGGLTITLSLTASVNAGAENTIKIAIADGGDRIYDSNLLIVGDSIQTALIAEDDAVSSRPFGTETLNILASDTSMSGSALTITQINGVPVVAGSVVTLVTGEQITLNADGSISVMADGDVDSNTFTYQAPDADRNKDTAFVTINTLPCFAEGTLIRTMYGDVPVEDLSECDRIITRDNGTQVLRWVGRRTVEAVGAFAPVRVPAHTLGHHGELLLSQQHRVLIRGAAAQLYSDRPEMLVPAMMLVEAGLAELVEDYGEVTYFHLLFDRHEIIWSNGLETESYFPAGATMEAFSEGTRDEIYALFPELKQRGGASDGQTALRVARWYEVKSLRKWFF